MILGGVCFILASYDSRGGQNSWRERKIIPPSYPQGYDKSMTDGGMYEKKAACRDGRRLCLQAEFFAYPPQSVMRFGYSTGYANAFVPNIFPSSSCLPGETQFCTPTIAYP